MDIAARDVCHSRQPRHRAPHARARPGPATTELEPVEIVDYHPSLWQTLKESFRSRHLIWDVAMSALNAYFIKYRLGPTWIVFNTFMGVIGWSLIGGKVATSTRRTGCRTGSTRWSA